MADSFFIIQPVLPKKPFKLPDIEAVIQDVLKAEAQRALRQYQRTVASWSKKPTFQYEIDGFEVLVGTDNEIYGYVDLGTKPHPIVAKNAPSLKFQVGYKPKTQVNRIGSNSGGSFGNWASLIAVQHPGTDARNFTKRIQEQAQKIIQREAQRAINKALKQGGLT